MAFTPSYFRRLFFLAPVLVTTFLLFSGSSEAALCFPPSVEKESPYHYLLALSNAFGYAKDAISRNEEPSTDTTQETLRLLYAFKLAKGDYECAAQQMAPYAESSSETISKSAKWIGTIFLMLAEFQDEAVQDMKATIDAGPTKFKEGTFLERQAEWATSIDNTWKLLVPACIAATYSVIEKDPATGLMSRLSLDPKERDDVLRKLRSTFGEEVTKGLKAGQISLVAAAASVYEVVGNQQRKTKGTK